MQPGRKKTADDGYSIIGQRLKAINTDKRQARTRDRRLKMEHVIMKSIMRLIVAGSVIAIAINVLVVFG